MRLAIVNGFLAYNVNGCPQSIERISVVILVDERNLFVRISYRGRLSTFCVGSIFIEPTQEHITIALGNGGSYSKLISLGVFLGHQIMALVVGGVARILNPGCARHGQIVGNRTLLLFPLGIKHVVAIRERVLITRLISFASALGLCVPASEFVAGARKPVSSNRYLLLGFATRRLHSTFAAVGFIAQKVCVLGVVDVDYVLLILPDLEHISRFNLAKGVIFEFLIRIIGRINSGSSFKKIRLSLERFARILVDVIHRKIRKVGCIDRAVEMPRQSRRNIVISAALHMELRPFRFVDDQ